MVEDLVRRRRKTDPHTSEVPDLTVRDGSHNVHGPIDRHRRALAKIARDAEPRQKVVAGRALISRAEVDRRLNMREQTLADLYAARETSGHPEAVHREGRRLYWAEAEAEAEAMAWAHERKAAKKAILTPVDRSGEPDELVDAEEAARILGYASPRTITSYLARNVGYFPDPDDIEGRRWHRRTLWAFADRRSRPGRAGHAKTRADQR